MSAAELRRKLNAPPQSRPWGPDAEFHMPVGSYHAAFLATHGYAILGLGKAGYLINTVSSEPARDRS